MHAAGTYLRVFREVRKMSQLEVAGKLQVSDNIIGAWELGKHVPGVDKFDAYCQLVRAPIDLALKLVRDKKATPIKGLNVAARYLKEEEKLPDAEIIRIDTWRSMYGDQAVLDAIAPELD